MQRRPRSSIRISQCLVIASWLLVLGVLLILRANWERVRNDLSSSFRLHVAMEASLADADVQAALQQFAALPEVASAQVRDPQLDRQSFFRKEPWAGELGEAIKSHAFPVVIDVALADPFSSQNELSQLVNRIEGVEAVDSVVYAAASHDQLARFVHFADWMIVASLVVAAVVVFLVCGALEFLRYHAESAFEASEGWFWDRVLTGLLGGLMGTGLSVGLAWFVSRELTFNLVYFQSVDILLLIAGSIVPLLTWASVTHALPSSHSRVRTAATLNPYSSSSQGQV